MYIYFINAVVSTRQLGPSSTDVILSYFEGTLLLSKKIKHTLSGTSFISFYKCVRIFKLIFLLIKTFFIKFKINV